MSKIVAVVLSLVLFVGSGAGLTASASQDALPGDTLYGLKTGLEGIWLALSPSTGGDFELHLSYAEQRVEEIKLLVANGQYEDLGGAVDSLENHLEEAAEAVSTIAESDPALAAEMAARYESFVTASIQDLTTVGDPALEDALDVLVGAFEDLHDDIDQPGDDDDSDDLDDDDIDQPGDDDDSDDLDDDDIDQPGDDDDSDDLDDDDIDEPDGDDDSDDLDDDDIDQPHGDDNSNDPDHDDLNGPDDDDDSDDLDDDDIEEPDDDDDSDDLAGGDHDGSDDDDDEDHSDQLDDDDHDESHDDNGERDDDEIAEPDHY